MKYSRIQATLHRLSDLAKPSFADGELHQVQDYEEIALADAYESARISVGCVSHFVEFPFTRAKHLALSFAWEQEKITGKPHSPITQAEAQQLFTACFLKPLVFDYVTDKEPSTEFFRFKDYSQAVRATFKDFVQFVVSKG